MKFLIIATALLSGGGLAMQNETVQEEVKERYEQARERFQQRRKENIMETIKETGAFPYPSEEKLAELTEEQAFEITSAIDQINATYDWANMTDEEIEEALGLIKEELKALKEELGIETPTFKDRFRNRMKNRLLDKLSEDGIPYPSEERLANLTEEQALAITSKIDEYNETYDWANMSEDEILEALEDIKVEMKELAEELGIELPERERGHRPHKDNSEVDTEETDAA